jgi:hypothetical protein
MAMGDNVRSRNRIDYNDTRGRQLFENAQGYVGAQGQQFQGDYGRALQSDEQMRNAAYGGFQNFINTGGLSNMDAAAMRSRAVSPIRSAYDTAKRDVMRLGGSTAGRNVLMARLARQGGQAMSEGVTNANANIAGLRQQGKIQGAQGMAGLYGTTPGQTALQSRNVIGNTQQGIDLLQMENNRMQGVMGNQIAASQLPGKGQSALNAAVDMSGIFRNIRGG